MKILRYFQYLHACTGQNGNFIDFTDTVLYKQKIGVRFSVRHN